MTKTFSQLGVHGVRRWEAAADRAAARFGISRDAYRILCRAEATLSHWNEEECNGTIQRDEPDEWHPNGRPRRFAEMPDGRLIDCGHCPDRAGGALRTAEKIAQELNGVGVYHQSDPRGCALHLYHFEDLRPGCEIDSVYSTIGHPVTFEA